MSTLPASSLYSQYMSFKVEGLFPINHVEYSIKEYQWALSHCHSVKQSRKSFTDENIYVTYYLP